MILVLFALIFSNLGLKLDENLLELSGFGYLVSAFRTSLGDF
jgi:hypothetical protein